MLSCVYDRLYPRITRNRPRYMERISFEDALKNLEAIVNKLEEGSVSLEESVSLYEEGMKLSKHCSEILEKAELRIDKVNQEQNS